MTRNRRAWELSDLTIRIVRNMLLHDDVDSLFETGSGTPDEAALMVRCYELAAMELWDESALIEAATVAGMDDGFTLSGESPERIRRKITIAVKAKVIPEYVPPPDGIKLLYRLGVLVYDELEETVTRFAANGRYDMTAPATDTAPVAANSESLVVKIDVGDGTFREALPVRAIPYVTGWDGDFGVPPLEVAIRLQTNINLHAWDISAFRVLDGKPVAVQPRQWVMVATQLSGLSEKLHRQYPRNEHLKPSAEGVAEWQSEAAEKLPARAFVWLDELKAEYHGWFGTKFKSRPNLAIPEFDLTPLLSEQVRNMVLEGFEQLKHKELAVVEKLFDEIEKLKIDIDDWKSTDHSKTADRLVLKQQLAPLESRLTELDEEKRVLRGDYPDSSTAPKSVAGSTVLSLVAPLETGKAELMPLTTGDIAFCFAGLRWTETQWKKPLGDKPKWLQSCIAIPGLRGVSETRWNPVSIGAALVTNGHVKTNSVRARFQTKPFLMPWLDAWKTYEADNFDIK